MMRTWRFTPRAMFRGFGLALLAIALQTSCAPTLPRAYKESAAAAERAYTSGRYDEAAALYRQAADTASRDKDRDEMLFLSASSKQRGGRGAEAREAFAALEALSPNGDRASRAAYEQVQLELARGDEAKGWTMLLAFLRKYPQSGTGPRALQRYVAHLDEAQGEAAGLVFLRENLAWAEGAGLGEEALYAIAEHLERAGSSVEARDTFLRCATEHPYPQGGLFDDALYRASLLDEKLGDPKAAIADLDRMLREREVSTFSGSYERPRYARSQLRRAQLYRDGLKDHATARREFRRLFVEFTTSVLRDDALWEEANLALEDKDEPAACEAASLLVKDLPDSRFAACVKLVCPSLGGSNTPRQCRHYIERGSPDGVDTPSE